MPTLDLKRITDMLSVEFAGDTRKIVFWYDDNAEFAGDVDTLDIGAKLLKLKKNATFKAKKLLERDDPESSYLVYAPFPKPEPKDNVLEDTLLYSRRFYADLASLIVADLHIDESLKPTIQKHIKFFKAKDRIQRFYDLEETYPDETAIEIAIMSAICKIHRSSIEEVMRVVLAKGGLQDNDCLSEFEIYGLLPAFWKQCKETFGYESRAQSLTQLAITMFVTYTARQFGGDIPQPWKEVVSRRSGSILAFLDGLMNNMVYRKQYDILAALIESELDIRGALQDISPEYFIDCDAFSVFDEAIIKWAVERLLDGDIGACLGNLDIPAICDHRRKKHYGSLNDAGYDMLESAYSVICSDSYTCPPDFADICRCYIESDYKIDASYRRFYAAFDRLEEASDYEALRIRVEEVYSKFLSTLLPAWNTKLEVKLLMSGETSQLRFFNTYIKNAKDKTVVIISDAFRYEVAMELYAKLDEDHNCHPAINHMISVLPSYTQMGMAALLPHKTLEIKDNSKVLVDGKPSDGPDARGAILKASLPNSNYASAHNLPKNRDDLRELFAGNGRIVYLYHDHIDNRGSSSENELCSACSEAINEIYALITYLSRNANVYRFIVTADHGFLYKRTMFAESDKIILPSGQERSGAYLNRRFIISGEPVASHGVISIPARDVTGGDDARFISMPMGANVFKTRGGLRYVHGGSSPQEMILPVISVKTEKGHVDIYPAKIALVSVVGKITNLITQLDFIQQDPISDIVKPAEYKLYFISEDDEKAPISNELIYIADRKESDPGKRLFRLRFSFKNKKYDIMKKYWLVAVNTKNGFEAFRHPVKIDIAFADDFGFGVG